MHAVVSTITCSTASRLRIHRDCGSQQVYEYQANHDNHDNINDVKFAKFSCFHMFALQPYPAQVKRPMNADGDHVVMTTPLLSEFLEELLSFSANASQLQTLRVIFQEFNAGL